MSELKIFGIACSAMFIFSLATAFALMFFDTAPLVTVLAGTVIGVVAYAAIGFIGKRYIIEDPPQVTVDNAESI